MIIKENTSNLLLLEKIEEVKNLILEQNTIPIRKWVDMAGAVKYAGISKSSLTRAIRVGKLKNTKAIGKRMFKSEWLDNFLEGK